MACYSFDDFDDDTYYEIFRLLETDEYVAEELHKKLLEREIKD